MQVNRLRDLSKCCAPMLELLWWKVKEHHLPKKIFKKSFFLRFVTSYNFYLNVPTKYSQCSDDLRSIFTLAMSNDPTCNKWKQRLYPRLKLTPGRERLRILLVPRGSSAISNLETPGCLCLLGHHHVQPKGQIFKFLFSVESIEGNKPRTVI